MSEIIQLTDEQTESMIKFFGAAKEAEVANKPGMIIAQVFDNHMRVGFLPHEKAAAVVLALGGDLNRFCRSAYEEGVTE